MPSRGLLPPVIPLLALAVLLLFGFGQNILLAVVAMTVLIVGSALLWRPGEPSIFLLVFCYQWLQASARIFHANAKDVDVASLSYGGGQVSLAIVLSLFALMAFAVGLRFGAGRWRAQDGQSGRATAMRHNLAQWSGLYALAVAGSILAQTVAVFVPGLSQPLLAASGLKWAFFWLLAYATFVQPGADIRYLLIAFGFEFMLGLSGYFSDFKTVFLITMLALGAAGTRISGRRLLAVSILTALLLFLGLIWTAVKPEYRTFVSRGEASQTVTVDFGERMAGLAILVMKIDGNDLGNALDEMINRIAYVDMFAVVLDRVPTFMPHENGAIWWDAISRPFMPRMFFPNKLEINDSERTNLYTGLGVAGSDAGTSISIGYIGESYIDFGEIGMLVVIFIYGAVVGLVFNWFVRKSKSQGLLGFALITAAIVGSSVSTALESSITKSVGFLITSLLVAWLLSNFVLPKLAPWLYEGPHR